ncbi:MAG: carboxypeptidase-like regulatory domain-containing protein [Bacteroidota bacterium]
MSFFYFRIFLILAFFSIIQTELFARQGLMQIEGKVVDAQGKMPLAGATVYLDNTTRATVSSESGTFILKNVPSGNYQLIISYVGYNSASVAVNAQNHQRFTVELESDATLLNEVAIVVNSRWQEYFNTFKTYFLGKQGLQCNIANPKTLHFDYNDSTKVLTARASQPIIIENRALGYRLHYDLTSFVHFSGRTRYAGTTRFEEITPKDKKELKQWKANREKAYYGSSIHFMRSLVNQTLKKEGFVMQRMEKTKRIVGSRNILLGWQGNEYLSQDTIITFRWKGRDYDPEDATIAPGVLVTTPFGKSSGYNILYPGAVPYENIVKVTSSTENYKLSFANSLFVTYKKRLSSLSTSILTMLMPETFVDVHGNLADPHAVINEGYWATLRVADQLPFDYVPE